MKNKFFQACLGVSLLLFSTGFLIRSFNPADAAPSPANFEQQGTNKIGKYMMAHGLTSNGGLLCWVWNTENGKSILYYITSTGWVKDANQLPQNPTF